MVTIDEQLAIDYLYKIISILDNSEQARSLILELVSFISNAPRGEKNSQYPKISIR